MIFSVNAAFSISCIDPVNLENPVNSV
jgi:hypothetical protein